MKRRGLALLLLLGLASSTAANTPARRDLAQALATDDGEAANATLARLSDDRATRRELGLDLVEAWWRVAHQERAINTLSKWRQEAPRSPDPIVRARARALTGSPFDVASALDTFTEAGVLCQLLPVAQALDAVGRRGDGQGLLDRAWAEGECPDAEGQRATWEQPADPKPDSEARDPGRAGAEARYVLGPGHEPRFVRVMPEQPGELAEGVGLLHLGVPEDHVEALYGPIEHPAETCAAAPLCLTLRHPSVALAGDRLVGPFALRVEGLGEVASEGLVDGISARLRSETGFDPWTVSRVTPVATGTADSPEARAEDETDPRPWALAALLLTMGLVWAWRRRRPSP